MDRTESINHLLTKIAGVKPDKERRTDAVTQLLGFTDNQITRERVEEITRTPSPAQQFTDLIQKRSK